MQYEGAVYRPPSEAYSLIIQLTIGCSQNSCIFCHMYKEKAFHIRPLDAVLADFAEMRLRYRKVGRIFLADGDALIAKTDYLCAVLTYIREHFPECERVTCYASPKSILLKTPEELRLLQSLGLSMVYLGLESGSDEVLAFMKKGVTAAQIIQAAEKIHAAAIKLSVTAISGLGGQALWREHAIRTGEVLSAMHPEYVGLLTLMIDEEVPLAREVREGRFQLLTPYDVLIETKEMLTHMDCPDCVFRSNHASNYLNLRGTLNADKPAMLALLDKAITGNVHLKSEWMRGL